MAKTRTICLKSNPSFQTSCELLRKMSVPHYFQKVEGIVSIYLPTYPRGLNTCKKIQKVANKQELHHSDPYSMLMLDDAQQNKTFLLRHSKRRGRK